ncbi:hypothetical protein SAMN02745213_00254 [Succinivibrio dextrinosolvens DSM 3072]|uniref:Uncharacterized protein n=1 Tax=Succinivibrio dextrinosolvens DSM 3072 TaxID=1123324 RepID=A0A1T4UY47_9GAMM|nr:hypothetical protein [Succinivibrio dextrinosolvens]SKA57565.1 hypothetical protein SAMN02745213_00254 [Succinivibrio dextrinosolvens DSM 3072]
MISYDIRDYISLLTLLNAFNSRDFRLSDEYLNKNTPLFPDNEYFFINSLLSKGLIVYKNAIGFDIFKPLEDKTFRDTQFTILSHMEEEKFSQKEIIGLKNEIHAMECCNFMNHCICQLRNTDNFSLSQKSRQFIQESLNVLTVNQVVHVIHAVFKSSQHLIKTGAFTQKIAASQYIHLFQTRLRQVLEGKQRAIEEKETPNNYVQSQYSQIFFCYFYM